MYEYWDLLPAGVRNGLNGRDQYKEAYRRQGSSISSIVAFVSRPIVGAEPSTVANQAVSENIVAAGQNGSCACM